MWHSFLLFAALGQALYGAVLFLTAVFLICLILIQRGRGGGLAGAFGGMGGQSAFGSKAGDAFTRFTIIVASVWIVICMIGVRFVGQGQEDLLSKEKASSDPAGAAVGSAEDTKPSDTTNPAAPADTSATPGAPASPGSSPAETAPTDQPAPEPTDTSDSPATGPATTDGAAPAASDEVPPAKPE